MRAMKRGVGATIGVVIALVLVAGAWLLVKDAHFDVLNPSGAVGIQERNLLIFALSLCALVVIPVYVMLGCFAWRYSEKNTKSKYSPDFTNSPILEAVWWGIPIAIIGVLSVVTWQTSHALDPYKKLASDQPTIKVQVVALEWKWLFIYPDEGIVTVNQLPVAQKAPIHFSITSDAPMSGFWIPALGTQIYAMNGMSSQLNLVADTTGDFTGYSTNINGAGYSDMKFTVHSMTPQKFKDWTKAAKNAPAFTADTYEKLRKQSIVKGEEVYTLQDPSLYQTILNKYMGSHGGMHDDSTDSMTDMQHTHMNMEGM